MRDHARCPPPLPVQALQLLDAVREVVDLFAELQQQLPVALLPLLLVLRLLDDGVQGPHLVVLLPLQRVLDLEQLRHQRPAGHFAGGRNDGDGRFLRRLVFRLGAPAAGSRRGSVDGAAPRLRVLASQRVVLGSGYFVERLQVTERGRPSLSEPCPGGHAAGIAATAIAVGAALLPPDDVGDELVHVHLQDPRAGSSPSRNAAGRSRVVHWLGTLCFCFVAALLFRLLNGGNRVPVLELDLARRHVVHERHRAGFRYGLPAARLAFHPGGHGLPGLEVRLDVVGFAVLALVEFPRLVVNRQLLDVAPNLVLHVDLEFGKRRDEVLEIVVVQFEQLARRDRAHGRRAAVAQHERGLAEARAAPEQRDELVVLS